MRSIVAVQEALREGVLWTGAGGAIVAVVAKLFSSEKPYRKALKYQEERIDTLESDRQELRAYIIILVSALRSAELDVPLPPESF